VCECAFVYGFLQMCAFVCGLCVTLCAFVRDFVCAAVCAFLCAFLCMCVLFFCVFFVFCDRARARACAVYDVCLEYYGPHALATIVAQVPISLSRKTATDCRCVLFVFRPSISHPRSL
jgi:hypothetical protein